MSISLDASDKPRHVGAGDQLSTRPNFIRHYYDVYQLLNTERVKQFVGTEPYQSYKLEKFGTLVELDLTKNPAFQLTEPGEIDKFNTLYQKKAEIYFGITPSFEKIIEHIKNYACLL